jgi:putative ABC transport system permease protein
MLGALVNQLVVLLSKSFLKLMLVAFVIAAPLARYAIHQWLQNFSYCVDISWWILALAGICLLPTFFASHSSLPANHFLLSKPVIHYLFTVHHVRRKAV